MADGLNDVGLNIETMEDAIRRLYAVGKIVDIHTMNELLGVWEHERFHAEKFAYNRKEVFKTLDAAEHALLAVEQEETKRNPLMPSRRMKNLRRMIADARIAGCRNCDVCLDAAEMRKAYFSYQDKVMKLNDPDAKPLMYDSWMLAMADGSPSHKNSENALETKSQGMLPCRTSREKIEIHIPAKRKEKIKAVQPDLLDLEVK